MSLETHGAAHTPEGTPGATPPKAASAVADTVKVASQDALAAFKLFATNPVGGLPPAYETLGEAKALRVGIAFGVVSVVCLMLGAILAVPDGFWDYIGFKGVMKMIIFAFVPFGCLVGGTMGTRKLLGGQGGLGSDCFIAGAAVLPLALCALVSGIIGNFTLVAVLSVFAATTSILMIFSGFTRTMKLTDRAVTIAIPVIYLLTMWLATELGGSMFGGFGGGLMRSNF